jgi:hypothetical protein
MYNESLFPSVSVNGKGIFVAVKKNVSILDIMERKATTACRGQKRPRRSEYIGQRDDCIGGGKNRNSG